MFGRGGEFLLVIFALGIMVGAAVTWSSVHRDGKAATQQDMPDELKRGTRLYRPNESEWASLKIEPVEIREFSAEYATEGRFRSTKIVRRRFSLPMPDG
jgi:hypothetical protein